MQKAFAICFALFIIFLHAAGNCASDQLGDKIFQPGTLKPVDSKPRLKVGDRAPDFTLPSVSGEQVRLGSFVGKKNVVITFVPAAWTPVCSEQWPGYNVVRSIFEENDTILLGITTDNIPTLYAWTTDMGKVWFPVLSDFWPHGKVARQYGVLRSNGTTERALFVIDKKGIIRYIDIHDINERPPLEDLMAQISKLKN